MKSTSRHEARITRRPARLALVMLFAAALLTAFLIRPDGLSSRVRAAAHRRAGTTQTRTTAEELWQEIGKDELARRTAERQSLPTAYRALRVNRAGFGELLRQAPPEFSASARKSETVVALPLPDGTLARFRVVASSIMEPALQARFPELQTYRGQGIDDPTATTRFDWTPEGLHAIVLSARGTSYVEPYARGDNTTHLAYAHRDLAEESGALACMVTEAEQEQAAKLNDADRARRAPLVASGTTLRTYRLAVAATAEYTQTYGGGTVGGALSAITTTINLVDAIYERDVAVRLVLVEGETSIIFTDTTTDGYTSDNVGTLVSENPTRLNNVIGAGSYDIGHVFDGRSAGGGFSFQGQAGIGVVCTANKGRGATIFRSVQPSNVIAYYIAAHEMGHQFGATHTFNANIGDCGIQRASITAYEPGTGTTIMGYRFNCGSEDLRSADTYFHLASIEQIVNYTTSGNGGGCPAQTATGNSPPTVSAGANYTIPAGTPFTLTASGSDPDGDALTYAWEEFDLGPSSPPDTDDGARPLFRSFAPTTNPARTFPRLSDILFGIQTFGETLPTTTRTMNFRVTARDNRTGGGGVGSSAAMQLNVRADSGPFVVSAPAGGTNWPGNSLQTVTWNVANTANAPVSCASVRILLSTDGGNTFPNVLAGSTPNDGTETVLVPNLPTSTARIKVEAVGNVFFDISDANFNVLDNPCSYTLTATNLDFGAAGGAGSITVATTSNCAWAATSNASWITITAGATGSGNGTVSFTVAANQSPARTGTLTVAGQTFTVTQGNGCTYSVGPPGLSFSPGGGPGTLTMTTGPGCPWTASSLVPWITITNGSGTGSGPITFNVAPNPGPARSGQILHTDDSFYTVTQAAVDTVSVQFSAAAYSAGEGDARATITVTRTGDTTGPASVNYQTVDDPAAVRCDDTVNNHGAAYARCDYATTIDTLNFAAGETQKTFTIPLIDDAHVEGAETLQLRLSDPVGAVLGTPNAATLTVQDNDTGPAPNPVFNNAFFVRQQYLDFLSREPDQGGFNAYLNLLNNCPDVNNVDPNSPSAACDRITVSAAFFGSQEFQLKGFFVFRFYRVAFNRLPAYAEVVADMRGVTGRTAAEVFQKKAAFANTFTQRPEFTNAFGSLSNADYVNTLLGRYGLTQITAPDPANPDGSTKVTLTGGDLTSRLNAGTLMRAQVLRAVADSDEVFAAEFNKAFVAMQYYGYLRRAPETAGFNAWLNYLIAHPDDFRTMVNGFMNSQEYKLRFGQGQP